MLVRRSIVKEARNVVSSRRSIVNEARYVVSSPKGFLVHYGVRVGASIYSERRPRCCLYSEGFPVHYGVRVGESLEGTWWASSCTLRARRPEFLPCTTNLRLWSWQSIVPQCCLELENFLVMHGVFCVLHRLGAFLWASRCVFFLQHEMPLASSARFAFSGCCWATIDTGIL